MTQLLIDAGNTRLKWALERDGVLEPGGHCLHRGRTLRDALQPLVDYVDLAAHNGGEARAVRPARVLISNVGGDALSGALRTFVRESFGFEPVFAATRRAAFGVRIAYVQPERLGVDRWLGMIAARAARHSALLVAGVGTAMTLDAVDADGMHLGGLIVPGLATMKESLLAGTAGIRDAGDAVVAPPLFATDTGAAVHTGAMHALASLIERAVDEVEQRCTASAKVLLTGGDGARIEPMIARSTEVIPDLVLRGLVVYARDV
jgi:type III pantothenate kinase